MSENEDRPILKVVNSDATPEEIAAIVAVFSALGSGGAADKPKPRSAWAHPRWGHRIAHRAGVDGWRTSGLPR